MTSSWYYAIESTFPRRPFSQREILSLIWRSTIILEDIQTPSSSGRYPELGNPVGVWLNRIGAELCNAIDLRRNIMLKRESKMVLL